MLEAYAAFLRSAILNQRRKTKQPRDDASVQSAAQKPKTRGTSRQHTDNRRRQTVQALCGRKSKMTQALFKGLSLIRQ